MCQSVVQERQATKAEKIVKSTFHPWGGWWRIVEEVNLIVTISGSKAGERAQWLRVLVARVEDPMFDS